MRNIAFKCLSGSWRYNLQTDNSDKDYKVFVLPTFEDLYNKITYAESFIGKFIDLDCHDIRKIVDLYWKSNIDYIQTLYSNEIEFSGIPEIDKRIKELFSLRSEIVTMNLPHLYSACHGMHLNKMKDLTKGTENTIYLVKKYGYDTKMGLHAYRMLDFIKRFLNTNFKDFNKSVMYDELEREAMLKIKNGFYTLEEYRDIIYVEYQQFRKYEEIYKSQPVNEELKEWISELIYLIVRDYIKIYMNRRYSA